MLKKNETRKALAGLLMASVLAVALPAAAKPCLAKVKERFAEWKEKRTEREEERRRAEENAEVDQLEMAANLINNGFYDEARQTLLEIDQAGEDFDAPRYYLLFGLLEYYEGDYEKARQNLESSIAAGQTDRVVYLYLAQTNYRLENYEDTIDALDKAGETGAALPATYVMRAQCHWKLEEQVEAFAALDEAEARFPGQDQFGKQRIAFLIELGLFEEAIVRSESALTAPGAGAGEWISLGEVLRKSRQYQRACLVLEEARLRFPGEPKVIVCLAHVYIERGDELTAAGLFEEASRLDPKHISEAAELYRRAGNFERALYLNARVDDQTVKTRQRLAILFEMERYEEVAAMGPKLSRLGLLADDDVRYALAYSLFKIGHYKESREHLKLLTRADLFEAGAKLMKAMEACSQSRWQCL